MNILLIFLHLATLVGLVYCCKTQENHTDKKIINSFKLKKIEQNKKKIT